MNSLSLYRIIISALWWGIGLTILVTFFLLSSEPETFGSYREEALDWIIPHLIPTMTLTGAVALMQSSRGDPAPDKQVKFAFLLTVVISLVYLALVSWAIYYALNGMFGESERGAVDGLYSWNRTLGIIQGLAASAIGVFFVRGQGSGKSPPPAPESDSGH